MGNERLGVRLEWRAKPVTGDFLDAVKGVRRGLWHGTDVALLSFVARQSFSVFVVVTCTWTNRVLAVSLLLLPPPPPFFFVPRTLSLSRAPEIPRASALSPCARVSVVCALWCARWAKAVLKHTRE